MEQTRIGLIGVGRFCPNYHMPNLIQRRDVEITAVCDISQDRLDNLPESLCASQTSRDYRDLLDPDLVDGVVVSTPNQYHYERFSAEPAVTWQTAVCCIRGRFISLMYCPGSSDSVSWPSLGPSTMKRQVELRILSMCGWIFLADCARTCCVSKTVTNTRMRSRFTAHERASALNAICFSQWRGPLDGNLSKTLLTKDR